MRILLLLVIVSFACTKRGGEGNMALVPPNPSTPVTGVRSYLALGDSYTIGQSVKEAERFPAQTAAILRQEGVSISEPVYLARTGWTTSNLQSAIAGLDPLSAYDAVTLLIGVNDQYQGMDTGGYARRFAQLLEKAIQLARGDKTHVFVLSIPDYSATPFVPASEKERVRREIGWFNDINRRITTVAGVSYTDITPLTREAETNAAFIAGDGLHPSGLDYGRWAGLLAPKMKAVLR